MKFEYELERLIPLFLASLEKETNGYFAGIAKVILEGFLAWYKEN